MGIDSGAPLGATVFDNLLQLPSLLTGSLGTSYIGWFDTPVPSLTSTLMIGAVAVLGFVGLGTMSRDKALVVRCRRSGVDGRAHVHAGRRADARGPGHPAPLPAARAAHRAIGRPAPAHGQPPVRLTKGQVTGSSACHRGCQRRRAAHDHPPLRDGHRCRRHRLGAGVVVLGAGPNAQPGVGAGRWRSRRPSPAPWCSPAQCPRRRRRARASERLAVRPGRPGCPRPRPRARRGAPPPSPRRRRGGRGAPGAPRAPPSPPPPPRGQDGSSCSTAPSARRSRLSTSTPTTSAAAVEGCNEILASPGPTSSPPCTRLLRGRRRRRRDGQLRLVLPVLAEYDIADRAHDLNVAAARIAREVADGYAADGRPRYVAGSIGPGHEAPRASATSPSPTCATPTRSRPAACSRAASTCSSSRPAWTCCRSRRR